jgi:lipoprotein-releasing system permease protein
MVMHEGGPAYPAFRGVDLGSVEEVVDLQRFVHAGSIADLDDDSVMSERRRGAADRGPPGRQGGNLLAAVHRAAEARRSIFLPREYRVADTLKSGTSTSTAARFTGRCAPRRKSTASGAAVHGVNVRLKPGRGTRSGVVAGSIARCRANDARRCPGRSSWESFLWVLNLEKTINFFLLLFIVIIAAFSVMSSLLISVVRKTREIGLLGALGGRGRAMSRCVFAAQAFVIGVTGTLPSAWPPGFGVLAIRNDLVRGIARLLNRQDTLRQFYQFTDLPAHTLPSDLILTVVAAVVISTLAGLLPRGGRRDSNPWRRCAVSDAVVRLQAGSYREARGLAKEPTAAATAASRCCAMWICSIVAAGESVRFAANRARANRRC